MNCNSFKAVESMTYSLIFLPPPTGSFCFLFRVSFTFCAHFNVNNNNKTSKNIVYPQKLYSSLFLHLCVCFYFYLFIFFIKEDVLVGIDFHFIYIYIYIYIIIILIKKMYYLLCSMVYVRMIIPIFVFVF